jgi:Tfp pilus assembly protein PilZ
MNARAANRIKTSMQVYFVVSHQRIQSSVTVDLTTGGLYLETNYPFKVDEMISLIVALPDHDKTIKCNARISWVNNNSDRKKPEIPPGVGVQFLDVRPPDIQLIQEYLK